MSSKILVVDDEPDLELLILQKFRKRIYENELNFIFARDGVEALSLLDREEDINLVLSDINMPEMDGLTLLQKIKEKKNPVLKTVIVSAYGDMENIRTAMNRGAFDFITKPIDFNDLNATLDKTLAEINYIEKALQEHNQLVAMKQDLDTAARIQQSILPGAFPAFPDHQEFDIYAEMIPAREVGGDFYDFFLIDDDRLGFVIGDVSGKGIPAAIYMAVSRTLLKATAFQVAHPGECLRRVNSLLVPESDATTFVTIFYGILNIHTGDVQYCNGGHNLPYVIRTDNTVDPLPTTDGLLLGKIPNIEYDICKIKLEKGDTLFLYTDGVTEAMDQRQNFFQEDRLENYLENTNGAPLQKIVKGSILEVLKFAGSAPQSDDITLLALRYQ